MGHTLEAFVFRTPPPASSDVPSVRAIPLRQGLYLLPVTDKLFDQVQVAFPEGDTTFPAFSKLSDSLLRFARTLAKSERFAYIETEYFGGEGVQAAGVWQEDAVELEPRQQASEVVNEALRLMGASPGDSHDEFDAVGLGRHRSNEAWIESLDEGQCEDGYPTFDDAVSRFRAFLRQQKLSDDIRWITMDDCALKGPQLFVRIREQSEAESKARDKYAAGIPRRLGVKLAMLCSAKKASCCYVYVPETEEVSEYALMPDGLKLSIPQFVRSAKIVKVNDQKTWHRLCALPEREWIPQMFK